MVNHRVNGGRKQTAKKAQPKQSKLWEAALKIPCPYCRVAKRKDCVTFNRRTADQPHAARIRAGEIKKAKDAQKAERAQVTKKTDGVLVY